MKVKPLKKISSQKFGGRLKNDYLCTVFLASDAFWEASKGDEKA